LPAGENKNFYSLKTRKNVIKIFMLQLSSMRIFKFFYDIYSSEFFRTISNVELEGKFEIFFKDFSECQFLHKNTEIFFGFWGNYSKMTVHHTYDTVKIMTK
jgi:hypothetical protein